MIEKRSKLGESQTLQQFSRDVDEIEAWISEKLQTATDESYKDPTNIQVLTGSLVGPLEPQGFPLEDPEEESHVFLSEQMSK